MWYWIKTNRIIKSLFSKYVWDIPTVEKKVYLTFDDGPTPEITHWVLNQLKQYDVKATFFCIGDNVRKYPEIFDTVIQDGHTIGNHTYSHYNGWKTDVGLYLENTERCETIMQKNQNFQNQKTKLFRPPYGKIKKSQAKPLMAAGYKVIMWDVLSADFDVSVRPEKCLDNVLKNIEPGSIVVFHDSVKSFKNLEYVLPKTLQFLKDNQYVCEGIV